MKMIVSTSAALLFLAPCAAMAHPDPVQFAATAFTQEPESVACELTDGSQAQCYEFTVAYKPEALEIGPFCPSSLDETGGIWDWDGAEAGLYRLDRAFLKCSLGRGTAFMMKTEQFPSATPDLGSGLMRIMRA